MGWKTEQETYKGTLSSLLSTKELRFKTCPTAALPYSAFVPPTRPPPPASRSLGTCSRERYPLGGDTDCGSATPVPQCSDTLITDHEFPLPRALEDAPNVTGVSEMPPLAFKQCPAVLLWVRCLLSLCFRPPLS
jgi:hypothetical protein